MEYVQNNKGIFVIVLLDKLKNNDMAGHSRFWKPLMGFGHCKVRDQVP